MTSRLAIGRAMRFKSRDISLAIILACCACAVAFAQSVDISQYAHTAWRVRDGFAKGPITSVAQTPDGYLWLGTQLGLLRFDGVRAVPWRPPAGEQLPSNFIRALLVGRDGKLWIGTLKGLASWKEGKLAQYPEVAGQILGPLLQDRKGTVWFGLSLPGRLCAIRRGRAECQGAGPFGEMVLALNEDPKGNLWVATRREVWRWAPGRPERYRLPGGVETNALIAGDSGALLMATNDGLKQLVGGRAQGYALPGVAGQFRPGTLVRTKDGSLWIGTEESLLRMHQGRTDRLGAADGLSGDGITNILEDREGNVWVSTVEGLDRFRAVTIPTMSINQGLSSSLALSVQATPDGSIWIGTPDGLNRWQNGQVTVYSTGNASGRSRRRAQEEPSIREAVKHVANSGLGGPVYSLGLDDAGRLWASTRDGVAHFEGGRFVPVSGAPSGYVSSIAGDGHGKVWTINSDAGLVSVAVGGAVLQIPWARFSGKHGARALLPDVSRGGVWLGFFDGGIAYVEGGQIRASYSAADGLGTGRVDDLRLGADSAVWAATEGGLSRVKDRRITTLTSKNGLPCDAVHWSIEDDDHALWLYMPCGLVRIVRLEVEAWLNDPKRFVKATVFDSYEGVRSLGAYGASGPHVTKSVDGRIWFLPGDGVSLIDPRHLPFNKVPPPVHVEQIMADGKAYAASSARSERIRLAPHVRNLTIDYTALSLAVPEQVRFRFKLEGQDRAWREVVNQRRVEYSNLPPGSYRFRVTASNNSGVWNQAGAFLDFAIAPAYYQTAWFRVLYVLAAAGLMGIAYLVRLRQVAGRLRTRYQAALGERTRIAQELHDTLLQGFAGVTLQIKTAELALPEQPDVAAETLARVNRLATAALREARESVWDLRGTELDELDLIEALRGRALAATAGSNVAVTVTARGVPRRLARRIEAAALRVGREALANAVKHADASRIEIDVQFGAALLELQIRDDGRGFTQDQLETAIRNGHLGITSMQDRARQVGGTCEVGPGVKGGAVVTLRLPLG
ncbi:MAG: two-component regulator propeller domain-containing protein [Gemmatimonadales bacterium]